MPAKVVVDDSDAVVELVAKGNGGMLAAVRSVLTGHESQAVITADHRRAPGRENHPPDVGYADGVFGIVPKRSAVAAKARLGTVRHASQNPAQYRPRTAAPLPSDLVHVLIVRYRRPPRAR